MLFLCYTKWFMLHKMVYVTQNGLCCTKEFMLHERVYDTQTCLQIAVEKKKKR